MRDIYKELKGIRKRLAERRDAADDETEGQSKGKYYGNTRLPYGLCEKFGITIQPDWTPSDAWKALEGKGIYHDKVIEYVKKNGSVKDFSSSIASGDDDKDDELQNNKLWKKAFEKASKAFGNVLPKDPENSKGTDWEGNEQTLAIQGAGYANLYNRTANEDTYIDVDKLLHYPLVLQMDKMSSDCTEAIGGSTAHDHSDERRELRKAILKSFLEKGSARKNKDGDYVYDGKVKKENKACIVIGLPACGKSTTKVDPWSEKNGAFILDNDVLKSLTPEYAATGGCAAAAVHRECSKLNSKALWKFTNGSRKGENICIPTIGADMYGIMYKYIEPLEKAGYDVEIQYADGDEKTSLNRMINRAIQTGRIIPSYNVVSKGSGPKNTFRKFKELTNKQGKPYVRGE